MKTIRNTTAAPRVAPPPAAMRRLMLGSCITFALIAGCSSSDDDDDMPSGDTGTTGDTGGDTGTTGDTGGDTGTTGSAGASMVGFIGVDVGEEADGPVTEPFAGFIRVTDTTISARYSDVLTTVLSGDDLCVVSDDDEVLDIEFDLDIGETISAGETLTLTSPASTYATLQRVTATNPLNGTMFIAYRLPDDSLAGVPPSNLILDIPGDVFPAFSNVAVPDLPAPLTDFSAADGSAVSAATVFSWTPSGVASAVISLGIDTATESVDCLLVDDGNFTLPDSVTSQFAGSFSGTVSDADRGANVLARSDDADAVLFVLVEDGRSD